MFFFFFSSRRRHTRCYRDWSSDVCSSDLALKALEGDPEWSQKLLELLAACDDSIPEPVREIDKPFLMPIEDVFTITGRGTVVTGRVERGVVKTDETVDIV